MCDILTTLDSRTSASTCGIDEADFSSDWLLLSKRPENFAKYLPADWGEGYANVWLGVTCEDRKHGYPRVNILRNTPAKVRFLSCEPLLEDISDVNLNGIDWLIAGGESGTGSRSFDLAWAVRSRFAALRPAPHSSSAVGVRTG